FRRKLRRRSADDTRIAWRRRDRQNEAAAARRSDRQYKLPGPPRAGGRHLSQRNHQRSRHAARRIRLRRCGRRCRRLDEEIAGSNRRSTWEVMLQVPTGRGVQFLEQVPGLTSVPVHEEACPFRPEPQEPSRSEPAIFYDYIPTTLLTTYRIHARDSSASLIEGVF